MIPILPLNRLLLLTCMVLFYILAMGQEDTKDIKILSWNIYMLPTSAQISKSISISKKNRRAQEIADIMIANQYDIIVFQEAFHRPSRKMLAKALQNQYPYQYGPINKAFIKTNSGLFVVSKLPLKKLDKLQFSDCNSSDCLARKGSAIFEGEVNGQVFQLLATHLNSTKEQSIRESQYSQIYKELLLPYQKKGVAQIICGDLNTRYQTNAYFSMLKKLDAKDLKTTSQQQYTSLNQELIIDYILLRQNESNVACLEKKVLKFYSKIAPVKKLNYSLSDHYAIEAVFRF